MEQRTLTPIQVSDITMTSTVGRDFCTYIIDIATLGYAMFAATGNLKRNLCIQLEPAGNGEGQNRWCGHRTSVVSELAPKP